ncbi:MAG TPA: CotS family spore coat protein [Clostridiaceae bacterium]|nr:CotS family spore coat protein [Clostridiaceae bacterium]
MQTIEKEIGDRYGIEVSRLSQYKDALLIESSLGKKLLRRNQCDIAKIEFIHKAKEHLYENNFKNIDRYLCTTEGTPFFLFGGNCYTISNMIEGRECNFEERNDIILATQSLAALHKASKGFVPDPSTQNYNELGKLPFYLTKRLGELKKLKKIAEKGRSKFDHKFLEYVDYFYQLGENVIHNISNGVYDKLVEKTAEEGIICHHDYTHHNIIIDKKQVSVINFNYCCHELKVYDIANLIRRKMRKCNWNIEEARVIINEYRKINEISKEEFFVLKLMLEFPQKFWRVANKYYNSRRNRVETSYILRLQEVIDEIDHSANFLKQFHTLI